MKRFRPFIFWLHLVCGLISGASVGIMCFTGTALAFEKQLVAWSERDARRVTPSTEGARRLTIEQLQAKLREAVPEARPANVVIQNDPRAAITFSSGGRGGGGGYYLNPYTGEVRQPRATSMNSFMQTMTAWHRYLGFTGETSRPRGRLINGVCNLAFCGLAMTGLYLWIPRRWSLRGVKAVAIFNWRLAGKTRDFNWHNSIGLWSAPILIVLTLTAIPISFQWGTRVINALTRTPQPAITGGEGGGRGGPGGGQFSTQPAVEIPTPPPGTSPLSQEDLIAIAQKQIPQWETITISAGRNGRGGGGAGGRGSGGRAGPESASPTVVTPSASPVSAGTASGTRSAATFTVRSSDSWPRTASTTLTLNPYTGEVLRRTGYADQPAAQRVRSWTRFLHTGEAIGPIGQLVAGLACLGGCFLVYTGFALSWRRFFGNATPTPVAAHPMKVTDETH